MNISVLSKVDTSAIKRAVLDDDGWIKVLPYSVWMRFSWDEIRQFMHEYPVYVLPTVELIDRLKCLIAGYKAIEIGAGSGNIGRHLGIKMTDSYLQSRKDVRLIYELSGQPVIKYPSCVIKADALTAYKRFKPECVIGCYVTHKYEKGMRDGNMYGVDFKRLLQSVKRLVLVGNSHIHAENPIMSIPHQEIKIDDGLLTRNEDREADRIFVWDKEF
jgi:hypothetical protein